MVFLRYAFTVNATGSGLNYQWQFDGTNLVGATNSSLALTKIQLADEGDYSATVSNSFGLAPSAAAKPTLSHPAFSGLLAMSHIIPARRGQSAVTC